MAILLPTFIPVFALTVQEGKRFHLLAFTKTCMVLAATVMVVTLVPVLCNLLLGGKSHRESSHAGAKLDVSLHVLTNDHGGPAAAVL